MLRTVIDVTNRLGASVAEAAVRPHPRRVAAAVSFGVALADAGDGFAPAFKQAMAARLNGAPAPRRTLTRRCQP